MGLGEKAFVARHFARGADREALERSDPALREFQVIAVPGCSRSVRFEVEASADRLRKELAGPG